MSFRRPTIRRREGSESPTKSIPSSVLVSPSKSSSSKSSHIYLVDTDHVGRQRQAARTMALYLPGPEALVTLPGRQEFTHTEGKTKTRSSHGRRNPTVADMDSFDGGDRDNEDFANAIHTMNVVAIPGQWQSKKAKQWRKWSTVVIPSLIHPFMRLLHQTQSFREAPIPSTPRDGCGIGIRKLKILSVNFDCTWSVLMVISYLTRAVLEYVEVRVCACRPAALQLLERGLFPCSPIAPTLAASVKLLQFVKDLFVRMPPNTRSWADALETFLHGLGYKLPKVRIYLCRAPPFDNWFVRIHCAAVSAEHCSGTLHLSKQPRTISNNELIVCELWMGLSQMIDHPITSENVARYVLVAAKCTVLAQCMSPLH